MVATFRSHLTVTVVAPSESDPARVEAALRLLGHMVAHAYARDMALVKSDGHGDPAWIPPEEESDDVAEE